MELQSGQGKWKKSGETTTSFCRPVRANTLNKEWSFSFVYLFAMAIPQL